MYAVAALVLLAAALYSATRLRGDRGMQPTGAAGELAAPSLVVLPLANVGADRRATRSPTG